MIINKSEACTIFKVANNTLTSWMEDHGFPYSKNGAQYEIDVAEAIQWYGEKVSQPYKEKLSELEDDEDYDKQYRKWKSIRMKIEAVKESGQLITLEEADKAMLQRLVVIRDALKNIPLAWQHRVIGLEDKKEAQERLEELLDELLETLSNAPDEVAHVEDGQEVKDVDIDDVEDIEDYK